MPKRYTLNNLKRAINNPVLFQREGHRLVSSPLHYAYDYYFDSRYEGTNVMQRDWDNLLILDACRFDYFESKNTIPGRLNPVISKGKRSWEYMRNNFSGGRFHDTVYVTANPYADRLSERTFYWVDSLLRCWDESRGTVQPFDVVDAARDAYQQHPNKRLIVHFMQPHRPYLGPTADELRERVDLIGYKNEGSGLQIWGAAKEKKVTVSEVRQAYAETLDIVLDHVDDLISDLDGKTVITSDHGEMLGERVFPFTSRVWGHSEGFSTPQLRVVPWHEIESDERRKVVAEDPVQDEELNDVQIEERLKALGYKTE